MMVGSATLQETDFYVIYLQPAISIDRQHVYGYYRRIGVEGS